MVEFNPRVFAGVVLIVAVIAGIFAIPPPKQNQGAPPAQSVHLRGGRLGKFCAVDGNKNVQCNQDVPNDMSTFFVEPQADGRYAFKNKFTNQYCQDNGDGLTCNRDQPLEQEKFHWVDQPEPNTFAMTGPKSGSKRLYCSDEGNRIACNRPSVGGWEKFTYQAVPTPAAATPISASLAEGASVRCNDGSGKIYRYMNGTLRHYPDPDVANSWNPQWAANILDISAEQCDRIPKGPPMSMNLGLTEGTSVQCNDGSGKVYRYMADNTLRHYPDPTVATTWNPKWSENIRTISAEACSRIPKGATLSEAGYMTCKEGFQLVTDPIVTCVQKCNGNQVDVGIGCREGCREGYKDVAGVCWKGCGSDIDVGALCRKRCPPGWKDVAGVCWNKAKSQVMKTYAKDSYVPKTNLKSTESTVLEEKDTSTPTSMSTPTTPMVAPTSTTTTTTFQPTPTVQPVIANTTTATIQPTPTVQPVIANTVTVVSEKTEDGRTTTVTFQPTPKSEPVPMNASSSTRPPVIMSESTPSPQIEETQSSAFGTPAMVGAAVVFAGATYLVWQKK